MKSRTKKTALSSRSRTCVDAPLGARLLEDVEPRLSGAEVERVALHQAPVGVADDHLPVIRGHSGSSPVEGRATPAPVSASGHDYLPPGFTKQHPCHWLVASRPIGHPAFGQSPAALAALDTPM